MGLKFAERINLLVYSFSVVDARCDSVLKGGDLGFNAAAPQGLLTVSSGMLPRMPEEQSISKSAVLMRMDLRASITVGTFFPPVCLHHLLRLLQAKALMPTR